MAGDGDRISYDEAKERGYVTRLAQIPNIDRILGMKVINTPDIFTGGQEARVMSAACCSEAAYLATAFGPDFLDKEIGLEQFLDAFQVGTLEPQRIE
jgi:hypothetical protein